MIEYDVGVVANDLIKCC